MGPDLLDSIEFIISVPLLFGLILLVMLMLPRQRRQRPDPLARALAQGGTIRRAP
jgi:hypothetical protein